VGRNRQLNGLSFEEGEDILGRNEKRIPSSRYRTPGKTRERGKPEEEKGSTIMGNIRN